MNEISFSLIMPAYNSSKYIAEAVESVKRQTYADWELIIVNDGSTDNTLEIVENYAQKDSRIKVISQPNSHQGPARNNGFKHAEGEFIYFIDSDDILHPQCLETVLSVYEKTQFDICMIGHKDFFNNDEISFKSFDPDIPHMEAIGKHLAFYDLLPTPWSYFFSRPLLEKTGVDFPGYFHEDEAEIYRFLSYGENIVKMDSVLYFYRHYASSTMGLTINPRSADVLKVARRFTELAEKQPDFYFDYYWRAENIIMTKYDAWHSIDEDWARKSINDADELLTEIRAINKDNPYCFVQKNTERRFENSLSWKVTKPLRKLKELKAKI